MISLILSFLGWPLLSSLISAYKAKLESMTSTQAKAVELAEAEIKGEVAARQEATKILIAEQGRWYTAIIRPLFALPLIIYYWKILVVDTVFGLGTTPLVGNPIAEWSGWIILAYFGGRSLEKVSRIFANRF